MLSRLLNSIPIPHTHSHSHTSSHDDHGHSVDLRAAYFALLSIGVKEWLYRITYRVGKAEDSNVILANALHHRSDAFSSLVALLAIVSGQNSFFFCLLIIWSPWSGFGGFDMI